MSESEVVNLMQVQLRKASNAVRQIARRIGVQYAYWPEVRITMDQLEIDPVEIAEFLAACDVLETWPFGPCVRYAVGGADPETRIARMVVMVHQEIVTIEVINLNPKE